MEKIPSGGRAREVFSAATVALAAGAVSLLLSWTVLERIPHVSDGISYAFQGRIFASGSLFLPPPGLPPLFAQENVLLDASRWCAKYPPGWPLLLALGWLAHAPWLINPLLLAAAVLGVWALGRRLFDHRTGMLAAGALAVSPFALLMASGFMAHVPALAASVWCLAALAAAADTPAGRKQKLLLLAAGALGGLTFLIRPLTALTLLWPAVIWCLWRMRGRHSRVAAMGWLAFGAAPWLVFLMLTQWITFGHPLAGGYGLYDPTERLTGIRGVYRAPLDLFRRHLPWYLGHLNRSLWGFPWPDLALLLPLAWPGRGRGRDLMLAACAAGLVLGHCFYYFADIVYSGPRFAFESLGPLSILAARGALVPAAGLGRFLSARVPSFPRGAGRLGALVVFLSLAFFPLGKRLPDQIRRHAGWYHGVSAEPLRRAAGAGVGEDALILVSGYPSVYGPLLLENALPPERGGRVFVRDLPGMHADALKSYPRREVWRLTVMLDPLPGPNSYSDTARLRELSWRRLR